MLARHLRNDLQIWDSRLSQREDLDPILKCPSSVLSLLESQPSTLIKLAHSKIHSFQYDQVPPCWLRLYTDASIGAVLQVLRRSTTGSPGKQGDDVMTKDVEKGAEQWHCDLGEIVRLLDMAKIIAGASEREDLIEKILKKLESLTQIQSRQSPPYKKRKVKTEMFPRMGLNIPQIEHDIERAKAPSFTDFEARLCTGSPFVVTESLSHWPAFEERPWSSPSYLLERTLGGRRLIPVELGRSYTDTGWGQTIMPFKKFMDRVLLESEADNAASIAYLAQHDLFTQIPALRNDISIPDYCYSDPPNPATGTPLAAKPAQPKLDEPLLNAWFGPAGTVSPLHTDPYHNILCQVVGRKYVRLYSPYETDHLYPREVGEDGVDMSNTSQVDAEGDMETARVAFPLFRDAKYVETILDEGEALYIPVGWWHYVRSLDVSFSVSFWWN